MSPPADPEHNDHRTGDLQAHTWAAWQEHSALDHVTRLMLTRVGYGPADIPHLSDDDLLAVPRIGPARLTELRRHFPRATP